MFSNCLLVWFSLKEHSAFLKEAHFPTPLELNSDVLPFLNPFSRSPGLF